MNAYLQQIKIVALKFVMYALQRNTDINSHTQVIYAKQKKRDSTRWWAWNKTLPDYTRSE